MKIFIKRFFSKVAREFITIFTKRRGKRIVLISESSSGSNSYALWKNAPEDARNRFEIILHHDSPDEGNGIVHFLRKYRLISSAQLIITTHASYKPSRNHIHIQLWHGATIKTLGIMAERNGKQKFSLPWKDVDYIMSYSETYTSFLNSQMLSAPWKYKITGGPRNDFLFHSDGLSNLRKVLGSSIKGKRIIFHLPTYRGVGDTELGSANNSNIFGYSEFEASEFDSFLEDNNCKLIFKPHPHEDEMAHNFISQNNLNNVLILRDRDLSSNNFDLYELLNASEILITDYSSVFTDFLLLDRPMIFASSDLDSYRQGRGFVIESFEDWVPGPKAFNQAELQVEISTCLKSKDYYNEKRDWQLRLQHRYKDGNSSERMWEFIDTIM